MIFRVGWEGITAKPFHKRKQDNVFGSNRTAKFFKALAEPNVMLIPHEVKYVLVHN